MEQREDTKSLTSSSPPAGGVSRVTITVGVSERRCDGVEEPMTMEEVPSSSPRTRLASGKPD
jgi:hypothetical protein